MRVKYYASVTYGNACRSKWEVAMQILTSLFKYHTLDLKWESYWTEIAYRCKEFDAFD